MTTLVTVKGPDVGQRFVLDEAGTVIGRQPDAAIYLESLAVSRHHARVLHDQGGWFVEDMGSSNGTYVNGQRIAGRAPLTERDVLQVGPYVLHLQVERPADPHEPEPIIRSQISVLTTNQTLFSQNPAYKLQVVLEIAQHLGRTLDLDALLGRLLDQLLRLFPQADRGVVILCDGERLNVRAHRSRRPGEDSEFPFSRSLVHRALDQGLGLLSEDVPADPRLQLTATFASLNLRSFLCVPLVSVDTRRLGVIQLDCFRQGSSFREEDLEVLTAIGLQVAVVLDNAALHAERLREERLRQEVEMARDIQHSFLPSDMDFAGNDPELFARMHPAREMSGDLYDFFRLPDGRLAFFIGDVSGKGMPAALFMVAVRTLIRHLAPSSSGPADLLRRLHVALAADNPTMLYVTLLHGIYDHTDGSMLLARGGHPAPLLRRADGTVETIPLQPGALVGCSPVTLNISDTRLALHPGETLIGYTDGFTEAFSPDRTMFGVERLAEVLGGTRTTLPLATAAAEASAAVRRFTGGGDQQDDQTLLLLRRPARA
jgi:serine phosphatase RsbU (regulator of sigma subunit)